MSWKYNRRGEAYWQYDDVKEPEIMLLSASKSEKKENKLPKKLRNGW